MRNLLGRRTTRGPSNLGVLVMALCRALCPLPLLPIGLIARPSRHAEFTPLLMWYVCRLVGLNLFWGGHPGCSHHIGPFFFWSFGFLDHDHLLLCRFAMMAQAVIDLHGSQLEVIVSG